MSKEYTSLGLMSGTSGDGVDASVIQSDGKNSYKVLDDKYFKFSNQIYDNIHQIKEKIHSLKDLEKLDKDLNQLERQITLFHVQKINESFDFDKIDIIGFHGQTIYHNAQEKISKQIGNGNLLSQLTKKDVVYNFRLNDLKNGGEGAPLTPIFHQLLAAQLKINLPVCILNIGGISNITLVTEATGSFNFSSKDIGPGNCLIDLWVRKNSKRKFDLDGILAKTGKCNEIILEQAQELFSNQKKQKTSSLDVNDFDISFARGLSLEDGAATLTDLTAKKVSSELISLLSDTKKKFSNILVCGGGRKNKFLIEKLKKNTSQIFNFQSIDEHGINGDFIESQAFAFLAIRSILKLPITFPNTTGCLSPSSGGVLIKN